MRKSVGLIRFSFVFVGLLIVLAIVSVALEHFIGISVNGSVNQIVAVLGASSDAGRRFYKKYEVVPESGFCWWASFQMTLVEVSMSMAILGLLLWYLLSQGDLGIGLRTLMIIVVPLLIFVFAVSFVAKRFVFARSARHAEKAHLKMQEKSSNVFE